jgi:hypothetical protein
VVKGQSFTWGIRLKLCERAAKDKVEFTNILGKKISSRNQIYDIAL